MKSFAEDYFECREWQSKFSPANSRHQLYRALDNAGKSVVLKAFNYDESGLRKELRSLSKLRHKKHIVKCNAVVMREHEDGSRDYMVDNSLC